MANVMTPRVRPRGARGALIDDVQACRRSIARCSASTAEAERIASSISVTSTGRPVWGRRITPGKLPAQLDFLRISVSHGEPSRLAVGFEHVDDAPVGDMRNGHP